MTNTSQYQKPNHQNNYTIIQFLFDGKCKCHWHFLIDFLTSSIDEMSLKVLRLTQFAVLLFVLFSLFCFPFNNITLHK